MNIEYNRKAYLDKECTFTEYYSQFVDDSVKSVVRHLLPAALKSVDKYLNDIPMDKIDRAATLLPSHVLKALATSNGTAGVSHSDRCCVVKRALRIMVHEFNTPEPLCYAKDADDVPVSNITPYTPQVFTESRDFTFDGVVKRVCIK